MNFSQLKTLVGQYVDDVNFGYYTEAFVEILLNNAQIETQKRLIKAGENRYVKCVETSTIQNQADYVLPEDFLVLNRLAIIDNAGQITEFSNPVVPITLNQKDLVRDIGSNAGKPSFYTFKRNRLVLYQIPDQVYTLRLHYSYQAAGMVVGTDVPDVPEVYQELIALLAAKDCFIKDNREFGNLQSKIDTYMALMAQDAKERNVDVPRQIVQTESYVDWDLY